MIWEIWQHSFIPTIICSLDFFIHTKISVLFLKTRYSPTKCEHKDIRYYGSHVIKKGKCLLFIDKIRWVWILDLLYFILQTQSCIKFKNFKRSSIELAFNSSSKFLSFLSFMKEREGNFELELKVSSFELLVNFLNSIQLWTDPISFKKLDGWMAVQKRAGKKHSTQKVHSNR